ncbi:MAG: hypothetical protein FWF53_00105 [Candidatus Azobacteroides sp.]|nr:hypothetical protein [Candidatus Azobacteroides sp.]
MSCNLLVITLKNKNMVIERTADEFVIRIPVTTQVEQVQDMIDYLRYKELTSTYEISQSVVDTLAREINKSWWEKNRSNYEV